MRLTNAHAYNVFRLANEFAERKTLYACGFFRVYCKSYGPIKIFHENHKTREVRT